AEIGHGGAAGHIAGLGILPQVSNQNRLVDAACHCCSSSCRPAIVFAARPNGISLSVHILMQRTTASRFHRFVPAAPGLGPGGPDPYSSRFSRENRCRRSAYAALAPTT